MKHIKTYKLFESKFEDSFIEQYKRIYPTLRDILLPLVDSEILYGMYNYSDDHIGEVFLFIKDVEEEYDANGLVVSTKLFTWKQVKEEILHVISFMDSEDIPFSKLEIKQFINNAFHTIEIYDESEVKQLEDDLKFTEIDITFCKIP